MSNQCFMTYQQTDIQGENNLLLPTGSEEREVLGVVLGLFLM